MKKLLSGFLQCVVSSFLLTACASGYHAIKPDTLDYTHGSFEDNLLVEYNPGTLKGMYADREVKSGVKLIAVKIVNNTQREVIPKRDIKVFSGENEVPFMPLSQFYQATDQNPNKSLKFLFLTPLNVYTFSQTTDDNRVTSRKFRFYPIGLILAPSLAFGNQAAATKANKKFKEDLHQNDILERQILHGETVYGLIALDAQSINLYNLVFKTNF